MIYKQEDVTLTHSWQSTQDNIQETAASASSHYSADGRRQDYFLPTAVVLLGNEIIALHLKTTCTKPDLGISITL